MRWTLFLPLGLSCLAFLSCQPDESSFSDDTELPYLIAYNVAMNQQQTDYDVWTVDPSADTAINITRNPKDVAWAYLAIDDKVLFISDRDTCTRCYLLYEMDADGSNLRQITDFLLRDSWMSSRKAGSEVIVNPSPKVDSAFYIIDRQGRLIQKVYTGLPFANDPVFSPDGQKIAFRGAHKKSKREEGFREEMYLINTDGSGLQQLTHYPAADTTAPWYAYRAGPPRWHPTESFITYQSMQDGKYSLFAVSPDGSRQWKLTDSSQQEGWHDWSPDGRWLAIEIFDQDESQFHIGLVDWQTKEMRILTDTLYKYQQAPVFVSR